MGTGTTLVTTGITDSLTTIITDVFLALGALLTSPIGGLIIFGLGLGYLAYIRKHASVKKAKTK